LLSLGLGKQFERIDERASFARTGASKQKKILREFSGWVGAEREELLG